MFPASVPSPSLSLGARVGCARGWAPGVAGQGQRHRARPLGVSQQDHTQGQGLAPQHPDPRGIAPSPYGMNCVPAKCER